MGTNRRKEKFKLDWPLASRTWWLNLSCRVGAVRRTVRATGSTLQTHEVPRLGGCLENADKLPSIRDLRRIIGRVAAKVWGRPAASSPAEALRLYHLPLKNSAAWPTAAAKLAKGGILTPRQRNIVTYIVDAMSITPTSAMFIANSARFTDGKGR